MTFVQKPLILLFNKAENNLFILYYISILILAVMGYILHKVFIKNALRQNSIFAK